LPELRRVGAMLRHHQREDGLWGNFVHDPQSLADTSGSAGLARISHSFLLRRAGATHWRRQA
jgi:rhamnogalacturonyl hydrolase YesR